MTNLPTVVPFESCVVCFKGDTTTAVAFRGEAEWIIAGLVRLGLPVDQAKETALAFFEDAAGCEPGRVPAGKVTYAVRVCRDCAEPTGLPVGPLDDIPIVVLRDS